MPRCQILRHVSADILKSPENYSIPPGTIPESGRMRSRIIMSGHSGHNQNGALRTDPVQQHYDSTPFASQNLPMSFPGVSDNRFLFTPYCVPPTARPSPLKFGGRFSVIFRAGQSGITNVKLTPPCAVVECSGDRFSFGIFCSDYSRS